METKPYVITGNNYVHYPAVVKVTYGTKGHYVIAKCEKTTITLKSIENQLNAFVRGGKNAPGSFWHHLLNYVKENPGGKFKVTILMESEDAYQLLVREQEELDKGNKSKMFLNNQLTAYVPIYNDEKQAYGWVTMNQKLRFDQYMKARDKRLKARKKKEEDK